MGSELKLAFKIIEQVVNFATYFLDRAEKKKRKAERDEIEEDPVEWFNNRYGGGMRDAGDGKKDGDSGDSETKS